MPKPTSTARFRRFRLALLWGLALIASWSAQAQSAPLETGCQIAPDPGWSAGEKWAWSERLCRGERADFNEMPGCAAAPRTDQADGWPACRTLSGRFLRTILAAAPWRDAAPGSWIIVENARFADPVNLSGLTVAPPLLLRASRLEGGIDASRAVFEQFVALGGSAAGGKVNFSQSVVKHNLFARNGAFPTFNAAGARIGGNLEIDGSRSAGGVDLNGADIGGSIIAANGDYGKLVAANVKTGGGLFLDGSRFSDALLDGVRIGGDFSAARADFSGVVDLSFARFGRDLALSGGKYVAVDAPGLHVGGQLRLGDRRRGAVIWRGDSRLNLRGAQAAALTDAPDSWLGLRDFDLTGFTYNRLGAFAMPDDPADISRRDAAWYADWLGRSAGPSSQPYEALAAALAAGGRTAVAREVMYAARERELAREQSIGALIWGWIKKALVGHGYRLEYALYWSLGLIALGVLVAPRAYKDIRLNWRLRIFFSITMFIPFLEINKRAALERLDDSRAIFFYFIIICGVAIPGMVAAALLGAIG